jgi:hypothetical protein
MEGGVKTNVGLLGSWFSGQPWGTGNIYWNNGWEDSNSCGEWSDEQHCPNENTDECVRRVANQYSNPSEYFLLSGPNSNTFAGTIARTCNLQKPSGHWTPGWSNPPAPPKEGRIQKPPKDLAKKTQLPNKP